MRIATVVLAILMSLPAGSAPLLGDLTPWQPDSFLVRWRDRALNADAFLAFSLDAGGNITEARIVPASPLTGFSFDFQYLRTCSIR